MILRKIFTQLKDSAKGVNTLQDATGCIVEEFDKAKAYLNDIKSKLLEMARVDSNISQDNIELIVGDIDQWIDAGLSCPPNFFQTSKKLFDYVVECKYVVFIGPYKLANGGMRRGRFFECFLGEVDVPEVLLGIKQEYRHPKDKTLSLKYIDGSDGLVNSNNVVFFPESISLMGRIEEQAYAVFTFEKFERIYSDITYPLIQEYFGSEDQLFGGGVWPSTLLNSQQIYEARCIWGYLHDMYHFLGSRPFDENIRLKILKPLGLLEEIKVDCQCVLLLWKNQQIAFSQAIIEYVLFERLLRYPLESDYSSNFDSGTGFFLSSVLFSSGALYGDSGKISINQQKLFETLTYVVEKISNLEALEDEEYKQEGIAYIRENIHMGESGEFRKDKYVSNMTIG